MAYTTEKEAFAKALKEFADSLGGYIAKDGEWTVRGFIDVFRNIYTISSDTKIVSKLLELHLFPHFLSFAEKNGYDLELATHQNWYPDLTFVSKDDPKIKFAVDLKTTYRYDDSPDFCNGFTLGSHGEYFVNRTSTKNIQYPYGSYAGHFCLGIIYSRAVLKKDAELKTYAVDEVEEIPAVIKDFLFFAEEKWKIASDKGGSGNTANIGSIQKIADIISGNGVFSKAGETLFDEYWMNYGKLKKLNPDGSSKKITSFSDYLEFTGKSKNLCNKKATKRKESNDE